MRSQLNNLEGDAMSEKKVQEVQEDKIPKGAIFVVSVGKFEDYNYEILACCRALREINLMELRKDHRQSQRQSLRTDLNAPAGSLTAPAAKVPRRSLFSYSEPLDILTWCEKQGYLEKLPFRELNLGPWSWY